MTDGGGSQALAYHELSKLWPGDAAPRRVDAALVPKQYKRYMTLPFLRLPPPADTATSRGSLTPADLSALLHYSNGVVRRARVRGRDLEFRAAACTGAEYHVEAYLVCGAVDGLEAGVYHYDAPGESLRPLRRGDLRGALAQATCEPPRECAVVLTSTFWRNAWRYGERAYRHAFWDTGTIVANLLAMAASRGLEQRLLCGFVDAEVSRLLGVDGEKEAPVCVVWLGPPVEAAPAAAVTPLGHATEPLSRVEIEYPAIGRMHEASSLADAEAVRRWRAGAPAAAAASARGDLAIDHVEQVIERRVSARRFAADPLRQRELQGLIEAAKAAVPGDCSEISASLYLVLHAVEGVAPGVYRVTAGGGLDLVEAGDLRQRMAHAALDQAPAGEAAVCFVWAARLDDVTGRPGERGYRAAQLDAAVRGGRVYLQATALGLRATGLTFHDDELARLLGLDPRETAVLFLVAAGR